VIDQLGREASINKRADRHLIQVKKITCLRNCAAYVLPITILATGCAQSAHLTADPATTPLDAPRATAARTATSRPTTAPSESEWTGAYTSPSEIGGFAGDVLYIKGGGATGGLDYRMTSWSDVGGARHKFGTPFVDGVCIYLPWSDGYETYEGKTFQRAELVRYTRSMINGRVVLMKMMPFASTRWRTDFTITES